MLYKDSTTLANKPRIALQTKAPKAKKAKTEGAKDDREDSDPWRLDTKDVRKDWKQMCSPPLHMFRYAQFQSATFTSRILITALCYIDSTESS